MHDTLVPASARPFGGAPVLVAVLEPERTTIAAFGDAALVLAAIAGFAVVVALGRGHGS